MAAAVLIMRRRVTKSGAEGYMMALDTDLYLLAQRIADPGSQD